MSKIVCPACGAEFPSGTLVCPNDGTEFFEDRSVPPGETELLLPVPVGHKVVLVEDGKPRLLLSQIDGRRVTLCQGSSVFFLNQSVLAVRPIMIGRADYTKSPPVVPEVDLTSLFLKRSVNGQPPVSRMHASIRLEADAYQIRAGIRASTWVRHSGSAIIVRVLPNRFAVLRRLDEIVFGHPEADHVRFRFLF